METKKKVKTDSQEFMEKMGKLMTEALATPDGMRALAASIAAPIEQEIARKEISSLLLTKHNLPKGERAIYQKRPRLKAFWISKDGEAREIEVGKDEIEIPTHRVHSAPMVDISILKHGNIGALTDIQKASSDEIRKEIDKRTLTVISSAVPAENIVNISGGVITEDALNDAISILEDKELTVKNIVLRGKRFNEIRSWDLDPVTQLELRQKGVIKVYGGANILLTSAANINEVLVLPDEEIGKMPIREPLTSEAIDKKLKFKTGWLIWSELGMGITRPDIIAKIVINP
ncbi:MAG TPA: hypothetical protein PLK80_06500 [bacterium]|nr:MAG: hypothetical protein BWY28_02200 [bacterium ADurb.Bin236]HPI76368.1 hypothetical protein [bacterium]HPN93705.1 hypothetical protein [bacterium]